MAHIRQSRPDSGLGFQGKVLLSCPLFARKRALNPKLTTPPKLSRQTPHTHLTRENRGQASWGMCEYNGKANCLGGWVVKWTDLLMVVDQLAELILHLLIVTGRVTPETLELSKKPQRNPKPSKFETRAQARSCSHLPSPVHCS